MNYRPWDKTHPQNLFGKPLRSRVDELEERVELLEKLLKEKFPDDITRLSKPQIASSKKRRGPLPRIPDEHLKINRYRLIELLEAYWPELQPVFRKATKEAVVDVLSKLTQSRYGNYVPVAEKLLSHIDALLAFLSSSEYHGDPRQIANAMAGVPTISWSTSLRRCRAIPADDAIGTRALRDYLRRNYRSVYRRIRNLRTLEEVRVIMSAVRTDDREYLWMANHPDFALEAMQQGLPREL